MGTEGSLGARTYISLPTLYVRINSFKASELLARIQIFEGQQFTIPNMALECMQCFWGHFGVLPVRLEIAENRSYSHMRQTVFPGGT